MGKHELHRTALSFHQHSIKTSLALGWKVFGFSSVFVLIVGCSSSSSDSGGSSQSSFKSTPESDYCSTTTSYSPATTISGTAVYQYRIANSTGLHGPGSDTAIRYAEIIVLNGNGERIQCGETSSTGTFSVQVPQGGNYTLKVQSRALNSHVKVSVLNTPEDQIPYAISATVSTSSGQSTASIGTLTAPYNGNIEGGAFFIYDQILKTNDFLRANTACASCSTFTVADKISIYWSPGVNPGERQYGTNASGLSFFSPSDNTSVSILRGLYILGGRHGDTSTQDTDHFDQCVIVHEYGHFLEDIYGHSDSPGGLHNGNFVIDPRLSWSEGWAYFLQAAVKNTANCYDTYGNDSGTTGINASGALATQMNNLDGKFADVPVYAGEGIYRELSVTRSLWDVIDSNASSDGFGAGVSFSYIWKVFSDSNNGFHSSNVHYRNIGTFMQFLSSLIASNYNSTVQTNFSSLLTNEGQAANKSHYAAPLASGVSGSCAISMAPIQDVVFQLTTTTSETRSHLFKSNDFFQFYYDGQSNNSVSLRYAQTSFQNLDLDLFVYKEVHDLNEDSGLVLSSKLSFPEQGVNGVETVNFSGLPAGYYLVRVKAFTTNLTTAQLNNRTATYHLENESGGWLCPQP